MTPATSAIVAANIVMFAVMAVFTGSQAITGPNNQTLLVFGADKGVRAMNGEYWRIVSNLFVHIGLLHCFMNMWIFAVMGPNVERIYGTLKFTLAYFFAGIIASLTSIYMNPQQISAGASGAVFGVFGLWFGFLIANKNILQENFVKSNMKSAVVFLIMVLASGFMRSGIDNAAHIGGVVAGFLCGFLLSPSFPGEARWKKKDFLGIVLMIAIIAGAFYLSYEKTHKSIVEQSVALSPANLKEPTAYLKNNKPQEAIKLLDALLEKQPNHPQAHYLRAHAYVLLNDDAKALADMNETLKKFPEMLPALQFKAQRLINLARFKEALTIADKVVAVAPDDGLGYQLRSSIYDRLDNTAKCLDDANEAVRLAPTDANAYSIRGYSYMNLGLSDDAVKDFSKAIELDSGLVGAMNGRMFAYFMQSDYIACDKQCMEILAKVGMGDHCAPYAVIMAAICRKQLGHLPERIALLNQALQTLPSKAWPFPIIQYLNEQIIAESVFQQATDNDKMTEAKTYVAFDLLADNKGAQASPMIMWVKEHGNKAFNEYDLVSALLLKLKK
jgi:membrane associated rhomboid family serine protease/lipoprotein NlpI